MYSDVVIVGAGPIGLALGIGLQQKSFSVTLVERFVPRAGGDNRWFAMSYDVLQWLHTLGVPCAPSLIHTLSLSHSHKTAAVFFRADETGHPYLAGMVASKDLHAQLRHLAHDLPIFCPAILTQWRERAGGWELTLSSGETLCTPLVIGADGRDSQVRSFFTPSCYRWTFPQKAYVFTFMPLPPLVAYEHFFSGGSLALLPIPQGQGAAIWIGQGSLSSSFSIQTPSMIQAQLEDFLHQKVEILELVRPFDLYLQWVKQKVFKRCVLVGDAAQVMHPIAGQGLNVGLRNAKILISYLYEGKRKGLDWGIELENLQKQWRMPTLAMQAFTTSIVYGLSLLSIPGLWESSAFTMNHFPFLRRWMIEGASGSSLP